MKAKITRGGGFRGALDYAFDIKNEAGKEAERITGTLSGDSPRSMSAELSAIRKLRPDVLRPVWHCSLALPGGERLDPEKWSEIAAQFLERMGMNPENTPFVAVRHQDTPYDHIHIIASRVNLAGEVWHGKWELKRAIEVTQELEKEFGLTQTPGSESKREKARPTPGELNGALRTGKPSEKMIIQSAIERVLSEPRDLVDFERELEKFGVEVVLNKSKSTGRISGIKFGRDGVYFKGSQLGDGFSWGSLQKRGLRDDEQNSNGGGPGARFSEQHSNRAEFGGHFDSLADRFSGRWGVSEPYDFSAAGLASAPSLASVPQLSRFSVVRRAWVGGELLPGPANEGLHEREPSDAGTLRREDPGNSADAQQPSVIAPAPVSPADAGASPALPPQPVEPAAPPKAQHIDGGHHVAAQGTAGDVSEIRAEMGYVARQLAAMRVATAGGGRVGGHPVSSTVFDWPSAERATQAGHQGDAPTPPAPPVRVALGGKPQAARSPAAPDLAPPPKQEPVATVTELRRRELELEARISMRQQSRRGRVAPPDPVDLAKAQRDLPGLRKRYDKAKATREQSRAVLDALPWWRPLARRAATREQAEAAAALQAAAKRYNQTAAVINAASAAQRAADADRAARADAQALESVRAQIKQLEQQQKAAARAAERWRIGQVHHYKPETDEEKKQRRRQTDAPG